MGKRKTLTDIERGRISEFHKQNLAQRVIAGEIGGSKKVIANFLKDSDAYGAKKHTSRHKKISLAFGRRIRRKVRKS